MFVITGMAGSPRGRRSAWRLAAGRTRPAESLCRPLRCADARPRCPRPRPGVASLVAARGLAGCRRGGAGCRRRGHLRAPAADDAAGDPRGLLLLTRLPAVLTLAAGTSVLRPDGARLAARSRHPAARQAGGDRDDGG